MKKRIVPVVIAAIVNANKFLMTKRVHLDPEDYQIFHNSWQLPGGEIDFGETAEAALLREIKEELGVEIIIQKLLPKVYIEVRKQWQGILIVYLCRLKEKKSNIRLNNEASGWHWYSLEEAASLKILPRTIEIMKDALRLPD